MLSVISIRGVGAATCLLAGLAVLPSCGGSGGGGAAGSFVGRAANSEAFVTLVTDGPNVRAYICDGTPTRELTVEEWFKGTKSGDDVDLVSLSGIAHLTAHVTRTRVTGAVTVPGQPELDFDLSPADGNAGFYLYKRIHAGFLRWGGWIVLPSGEVRGSQPTPVRTSLGVSFEPGTAQGQLPGIGQVPTLRLISGNVQLGFSGCAPLNCL